MVRDVDMDKLRTHWYNLGIEGKKISGDDALLFRLLDEWQKQELRNAYLKAAAEVVATW